MFFFRKKSEMIAPAKALRGRADAIPTARTHFLNGRELKGPYPDGIERAVFGMGCFWGAERKFWELEDGIWITAVGYAAGFTPNPTYEEVCSGQTGHNEVVLVAYDPAKLSYEQLLKTFWENHDPTQGMRQGNDAGTQYRSGIYVYSPEQRAAAEASKEMFGKALAAKRFGCNHHRDPRRAGVLLRRGLSPAVPRQGPARLLRPRRHRRRLPDRDGSEGGGVCRGRVRLRLHAPRSCRMVDALTLRSSIAKNLSLSPCLRGEGQGEGRQHTLTSEFVTAPHPSLLPARGEKGKKPAAEGRVVKAPTGVGTTRGRSSRRVDDAPPAGVGDRGETNSARESGNSTRRAG